VKKYIKY